MARKAKPRKEKPNCRLCKDLFIVKVGKDIYKPCPRCRPPVVVTRTIIDPTQFNTWNDASVDPKQKNEKQKKSAFD